MFPHFRFPIKRKQREERRPDVVSERWRSRLRTVSYRSPCFHAASVTEWEQKEERTDSVFLRLSVSIHTLKMRGKINIRGKLRLFIPSGFILRRGTKHSLFSSSINKRNEKSKASCLFLLAVCLDIRVWKRNRNRCVPLISFSVPLLLLLILSTKKGRKRKKKLRRECLLYLCQSILLCLHSLSPPWSASGRHVGHEVELVLTQPKLWQLVGSVQTQLHHQRHENLLVHGVKVDNPTWARALGSHADADAHPASGQASGRAQELVPGS